MTALADAAWVDFSRLDELTEMLGRETTDRLIAAILQDLRAVPVRVVDLLAQGHVTAARRSAHSLRGAALSIGCDEVARLCAQIETDSDETLEEHASRLERAAGTTAVLLSSAS